MVYGCVDSQIYPLWPLVAAYLRVVRQAVYQILRILVLVQVGKL